MEDLVVWLRQQLDEDERAALESIEQAAMHLAGADTASVSVWHVVDRPATGTFVATRDQWDRVAEVVPTYGGAHAAHIVLHDPAAVLADIAAKRAIIGAHAHEHECIELTGSGEHGVVDGKPWELWEPQPTADYGPCFVLRTLASAYRHRPGWRVAWEPRS